jgi:hypothetical protein
MSIVLFLKMDPTSNWVKKQGAIGIVFGKIVPFLPIP